QQQQRQQQQERGLVGKLKGRVSDAPFIGCGGYVNNIGGATVTGFGEAIMKVTLARDVVYNMENGQNAQESAENALEKMKRLVNGHGGVVTIDKEGNFGKAFTTHMMVWASIKSNTMEFGMEKDEVEVELVKLNGEHK
ncbi:isoaspartyl peptidase L-asparaginase-like, partial [Paramuricea clavata]